MSNTSSNKRVGEALIGDIGMSRDVNGGIRICRDVGIIMWEYVGMYTILIIGGCSVSRHLRKQWCMFAHSV